MSRAGIDDSLGGGESAARHVGVNLRIMGRGLELEIVHGSPGSGSSDSDSDADSDSDNMVKKGVAKDDEDVEEEEAEQVPAWVRYMPRNDWTMPVEVPRIGVSVGNGVEVEDDGAMLAECTECAEHAERAGDLGSKAVTAKPIPKSSNPFSAEKVLTRARVRREAQAVRSPAGAGAGAHDDGAPSDVADGRGYVAGRSGGGGRVHASAHKGAHRVNPYDTYGSARGRPALQRPKASVCEATALLDMWNVTKGD